MLSRQIVILLKSVWKSCKISASIVEPYRPRISNLVNSSEWAIVRSPLVLGSICGKALIAARKCISYRWRAPRGIMGVEKRFAQVSRVSTASAHRYLRVLQSFICWAILRKRLNHPNLVPFIGATVDPPQIVAERMPRRGLIEYLEEHPEANRIGLVSPLLFIALDQQQ